MKGILQNFFLHIVFPLLGFLSRHLVLHLIHLADVSPGQLRAAEDVPGEGTLAAPLPRNDREGQASARAKSFPTCVLDAGPAIVPGNLHSVCLSSDRISWTTPATASLRSPITATRLHRRDGWTRIPCCCWQIQHAFPHTHTLLQIQPLYPACREKPRTSWFAECFSSRARRTQEKPAS